MILVFVLLYANSSRTVLDHNTVTDYSYLLCTITPDNRCLSYAIAITMTPMMRKSREQPIHLQSCQRNQQNVQFHIAYSVHSKSQFKPTNHSGHK